MIAAILLAVITLHPDPKINSLPHPYVLLDSNEWAAVRAKVEKYDWAKDAAKGFVAQAERWNVPGVRNPNNPKQGDWLFQTQVEHDLMAAGIAYQLTGEKKLAEKVRTFLLRLSDPKNGFPVTRRGCNQASVQEGHFFQHIAMAYDMAIPSGVFTAEDRKQIDDTLRLFIGEERDLGSNNISNWCVSWNCGALYSALVIGDLKAADWILNTPGGVLDQLQRGVLDDGWWYECSISYNVWCATEFTQVAIAMRRWGMDLVNATWPGGYRPEAKEIVYGFSRARWGPVSKEGLSIKKMWDALPPMLDYRGVMFGLNDSAGQTVGGNALDIAYYVYRDPAYAAVIERSGVRDLLYAVPELPDGPDLSHASAYADNAGVVVLRSQTENRPQPEQIQAALHYGDHGWFHGHFDRTDLLHVSRYGLSFYNPEFIWYGYPNYMYKFYVQTSVNHNMVVVDQKMQEPSETLRTLFHSGKMMQAVAVQGKPRWSNPPFGGMVYSDQTQDLVEKQLREGRSFPIPANAPKYGAVTDYSEPVSQKRLMIVTDDYIVFKDDLAGEREHTFESVFQMGHLQGLDGMKFSKHTGQWTTNPLSSAQFVVDCDWYDAKAPAVGRYQFDFGKEGVLKMNVHTLWPAQHEIMIGRSAEPIGGRRVAYTVKGDGNVLTNGVTGLWILGAVDVDVPVTGVKTLELSTDQRDPKDLFWVNANVKGNVVTNNSTGGPIKVQGVPYAEALPANTTIDLIGQNATRFKATFGADIHLADPAHRRNTVAVRAPADKEAHFITVIEPYRDQPVIKSATATADSVRVELSDGRVQAIDLKKIAITETKGGKVIRSEVAK